MSEPKLISPMLDNFAMGDPITDRNGVRCCPAMENDTENKYIVKIISIPSSQTQLEALLLSGAYSDKEAALSYFETLSEGITEEAQILQKLSQLEGFVPFENWQIVPMEDAVGFDIYLLSKYRKTLHQHFRRSPMTHLGALNLGLDLCAALAVCRRSGYLFVDLKPENVYITAEHEYRIGDIGFLKLDALKYASLPDRCRSQYTAPEIADAFSELNATVDIYALGLILYQAYNDGMLPFKGEAAPTEAFPPPAYADYEMAEIILKACNPDPQARWQDPIEMGQALVNYMQRNGANDTPIIPVPEQPSEAIEEELLQEESEDSENTDVAENITETEPEAPEEAEAIFETSDAEESVYAEDDEGNLSFLLDPFLSEEDMEEASQIDYEEVTEEVSGILTQADELISHPTPDPVIQPEPIDVPIPPPLPVEEVTIEESEDAEAEETQSDAAETEAEQSDYEPDLQHETEQVESEKRVKPGHWLFNTIIAVIALAILAVGFIYYKNYYLQPIESILLGDVSNGTLTVHITSKTNEDKLTVVCSDTYGNQLTSPVKDGIATFNGLAPNSAYRVNVVINGFHKLTGDTYAAFTTPEQTNIVQFHAVTGSEDGSVILSATIEGPDSALWTVRYGTEGEEEKEVTFSGHMTTLTGLTVGREYTFTLHPVTDLEITGTNQITHTASKIIKAENLTINGYINNVLTVSWTAPSDSAVNSWTVRCHNDSGFDETVVVTETTAVFEKAKPSESYTIEVTAAGMSVSQRAYASANAITVTDFAVNDSDLNRIVLTWNCGDVAPEGGWLLLYAVDGSAVREMHCPSGNTATLDNEVPGAIYTFTLQPANGSSVFGGNLTYNTPVAEAFAGYDVTADSMEFKMCKTPSVKNWDRYDLKKSDYTTAFTVGQKASFLVRMRKEYSTSSDSITTLFVIRDANDGFVNASSTTNSWTKMWYRNYCELDIPSMPQTPGEYTVRVYFNGSLATEQSFTVST